MKPFTQIAIPHDDVVQGRLTMDVFAADLWQVAMGKAPVDYQDPDLFFRKTYETIGLKNILSIAKSRLEGKSGDSVIQLQTPFGGGKTHTLIALYHKAKEWGAKVVVIDGTALDPKEKKLWEELERQLTGKIAITKGDTPPGKEKLVSLLSSNAPVLILMDEVLEYITKSAGIKVGDSNLSAQTLAFLQELTGAVATTGNTLLVLTLPSSILEHFDENAEKAFQQLQKITGRVEKIYTPVQEDEIEYVVRARLFSKIDENEAKKIVDEFVEYAKNEGLLSENEVSEYRNKFLRSYPFKPEVIDVLYKRWGSFPNFQRTRGVLRLLSIVVHELLDKHIPYIRLGDFDLNNKELRRELIKHIGQEWDSIIAQDITSPNAGAKRVDSTIGASYTPYKLGSVVSTTLFMMSFSGRGEREISVKDVKLSVVYPEITSSLIDTVINNLKEKLFYLSDEGLFFTNQPNLNRILLSREENITDNLLYEKELELLKNHTRKSSKFQIYIHPKFSKDVPDTSKFKLVILNRKDAAREFIEKCGETPRVYRNTLIFLCADEPQKHVFYSYLRKFIALKNIESDTSLQLNEAQKKKLKHDLKSFEGKEYEELRKYYNKILLPLKDEFKEIHLGIPIVGESDLENEVYENLRGQGEILEKISPKLIKDRYLSNNEYVEIEKIYETFLKTAGEIRLLSKEALEGSIREGVKEGFFGLGSLENEKPICKYFQKVVEPEKITTEAIIINSKFCKQEEDSLEEKEKNNSMQDFYGSKKSHSDEGIYSVREFSDGIISVFDLKLILKVPYGKFSELMKIVRYLNDKSNNIDIKVEIQANNVKLSSKEVKEKIEEAALQSNIEIEKIDIN